MILDKDKRLTIKGTSKLPPINNFSNEVEILDLSHGQLTDLPKELEKFQKIKVLFLSFNQFKKIPKVISKLKNLEFLGMRSCKLTTIDIDSLPKNIRWLTLTDNQIQKIPKSIGKLKKLEKLLLAGNKLNTIPEEIISCKKLALLRVSANNFKKTPFSIIEKMPNLAWYADAGNPFSIRNNNARKTIDKISWNDITIKSLIGESAQNKIYKASVNKMKDNIAVKIFGNQITSDGYPEDDLSISVAAGKHPHIIETIAEITDLPKKEFASALKIISNNFSVLGFPPNFKSCTRDTFSKNKEVSINYILKILGGVSSAQNHLHNLGIMNGDLYAHNILTNKNGYPYVGDFGAASLYDKDTESKRELIDVKAFGYLIEDLLESFLSEDVAELKQLRQLKEMCLEKNIQKRPDFKRINLLIKELDYQNN